MSQRQRGLEEENSALLHQINAARFSPPIGFITMFSGAWTDNSTIPGWYKCDGNNGTVNLVNKFVRGAATSGATGGSDNAVIVSHSHNVLEGVGSGPSSYIDPSAIVDSTLPNDSGADVSTTGESGTNKNIPAYYALIFIQRIS